MSEQQPTEFGPAQPMGDGGAWSAGGALQAPNLQPPGAASPTHLNSRGPILRNWYALASLGVALVLTPAALFAQGSRVAMIGTTMVGVVLALMAWGTARRNGGILKKTAVSALVLNVVMVFVGNAAYYTVGPDLGWGITGEVDFGALNAGDCVRSPETTPSGDGELTVGMIDRVLCKDEHWGQVYYVKTLADGKYPGDAEVSSMADEACFSDDAVNAILPSKLGEAWMALEYPTRECWKGSDHNVVCFLTQSDEALFTGSWVVED